MNFSETIKEYRKRNRLTLRQLSELSGVDPATLNRLERGLGKPRPKTVYAITLAMKNTPDEIDEKLNAKSSDEIVTDDKPESVNPENKDNNMYPNCSADVAYELLKLRELIERFEYFILAGMTLTIIASVYILVFAIKRG